MTGKDSRKIDPRYTEDGLPKISRRFILERMPDIIQKAESGAPTLIRERNPHLDSLLQGFVYEKPENCSYKNLNNTLSQAPGTWCQIGAGRLYRFLAGFPKSTSDLTKGGLPKILSEEFDFFSSGRGIKLGERDRLLRAVINEDVCRVICKRYEKELPSRANWWIARVLGLQRKLDKNQEITASLLTSAGYLGGAVLYEMLERQGEAYRLEDQFRD